MTDEDRALIAEAQKALDANDKKTMKRLLPRLVEAKRRATFLKLSRGVDGVAAGDQGESRYLLNEGMNELRDLLPHIQKCDEADRVAALNVDIARAYWRGGIGQLGMALDLARVKNRSMAMNLLRQGVSTLANAAASYRLAIVCRIHGRLWVARAWLINAIVQCVRFCRR
jgi:uncharacterized membrane-anchored protein